MSSLKPRAPIVSGTPSADESISFEWFMCRTAKKIPGCFASSFWDTLVLQACCSEPAVWHAVLALGSAHQREGKLESLGRENRGSSVDEQEQFTLRQYSKAIRQLQPHFSNKTRASIRVALVTCLVFICVEILRGNYRSGHQHLKSGMRLLDCMEDRGFTHDPSDDWLVEALCSFNLQAMLLGQGSGARDRHIRNREETMPLVFNSLRQARKSLDELLGQVAHLEASYRNEGVLEDRTPSKEELGLRQRLKTDLVLWHHAFEASKDTLRAQLWAPLYAISSQVLLLFHAMATIMADTCLRRDELVYDAHTHNFVSMINQAIQFVSTVFTVDLSGTPFEHKPDLCHFVSDIGWIPPMYYIATKCRVHRVRMQAIRLLGSATSREGLWNSVLSTSIARRVMEIEEQSILKQDGADEFGLIDAIEEGGLELPSVPGVARVSDVQAVLPSGYTEANIMICRRQRTDGTWEVLTNQISAL